MADPHSSELAMDESWWEDWVRSMADRAGPLANPPRIGSRSHHVLADGTGDYVHG